MKNLILRILLVPLLGFIFFSCEPTDSKGSKKTIEEAFHDVVKVLHAPYEKGDKFFKIFIGNKAIKVIKQGSESQVGDGDSNGSGTHTIIASRNLGSIGNPNGCGGEDNYHHPQLSYTYSQYQPKGSDIVADGAIKILERTNHLEELNGECDGIGFRKTVRGRPVTNTITISGLYDAELKFILGFWGHTNITDWNYVEMLTHELRAVPPGIFRIEFTYKGKTLTLDGRSQNLDFFKKLIIVS